MKWRYNATLAIALCLCSIAFAEDLQDAELAKSIVAKADQIRFPKDPFQVDIDITSTTLEGGPEKRKYRVLSKGNENTIVQTLEPSSDYGQTLLMRAHDLWVFLPNLSQPVRLSLSQRLTGEVANGDLARANFSGDYTPALLRLETIDGESYHVLELSAVNRSVTYHRVLYWVNKNNFRPLKAEFYSLSDRLLKTATYENFKNLGGKPRPTIVKIEDALRNSNQSSLEYSNLQLRDLPDKMFTKEYLKRLD